MTPYKQQLRLVGCTAVLCAVLTACGGGGEHYVSSEPASTGLAPLTVATEPATPQLPTPPPAQDEEPKPDAKPGAGPAPAPAPSPAPKPEEPKPAPPTAETPDDPPPSSEPDSPPAAEDQPASAQALASIVGVKVRPEQTSFDTAGATRQLIANAVDANGNPVPGVSFIWTSDSSSVVVSRDGGLLTARRNGAATISARVAGSAIAGTAQTVVKLPETLVLTPESWPTSQVWIGARRQFTAQVVNGRGDALPGYDMTWTSSNIDVLRVDETGLVTAHGPGTAQVTVTTRSLTESVTVTVNGEGANVAGYMYTTWGARTDNTPILLANGALETSEMYHYEAGYAHGNLRYAEIDPPWPRNTVEKFQYEGNRVALLTDMANGAGTLRVLDRASEWAILSIGEARDFALENNRIAMLHADGRLRVKEGTHGQWVDVASGDIAQFHLEGPRIGIVREDGTAYVKPSLNDPWIPLDVTGVTRMQLEGNRIGVLTVAGEFMVQDGLRPDFRTLAASGATRFLLEGQRIALEANGEFKVKDGIQGAWTVLSTETIHQFDMEGDYIGILHREGMLRVKEGINGLWHIIDSEGVSEFQLQRQFIGRLMNTGELVVRVRLAGTEFRSEAHSGVTQFRVIVDNPVLPFRTTPASYAAGQARCREIDAGDGDPWFGSQDCYPSYTFNPIASWYGVYCGRERPNISLSDARKPFAGNPPPDANHGFGGPIDGLDFLCNHHDAVNSWYPETFGGPFDGDLFAACVVRYGLRRGRLTRDGVVLATGESSWDTWDAAWGSTMPNLKAAIDVYWTQTALCGDRNLEDFDELTDAEYW